MHHPSPAALATAGLMTRPPGQRSNNGTAIACRFWTGPLRSCVVTPGRLTPGRRDPRRWRDGLWSPPHRVARTIRMRHRDATSCGAEHARVRCRQAVAYLGLPQPPRGRALPRRYALQVLWRSITTSVTEERRLVPSRYCRRALVALVALAALHAPSSIAGAQAAAGPHAGLVGGPIVLQDNTRTSTCTPSASA